MKSTLVTRDLVTGMRRGPIRWPDGNPPAPFGCRRCGYPAAVHGPGTHPWERPTNAQVKARMKARREARRTARAQTAAEIQRLARGYEWFGRSFKDIPPVDCDEMNHNSIGAEAFCTLEYRHDGLCDDGAGFTWLGVRNEERGQ